MTEQLYFDDPLTLDFTAEVVESLAMPDGRHGAIMPATFFYPTSGGQEHDTGRIGEMRVLDVIKDGDRIVHILDREIAPGSYPAHIDGERRLLNMQHHTGQHILSAAFLEALGIESLSANINGQRPSTIDLDTDYIPLPDLDRVEILANRVLFENRAVQIQYVSAEGAAELPLRKTVKVEGRIRVVVVEGFDMTPCGGTHCPQTGMIGLLKIVRTEHVNKKLRVQFVAGGQALDYFQQVQSAAQGAALLLDSGLDGVVPSVERLQDQLVQTRHELDKLRGVVMGVEAEKLIADAEPVGRLRLVTALFENKPASELRSLGDILRRETGLVAVLAAFNGEKLSLVAACADDVNLDARELLNNHLAPIGGSGGGSPTLAQGGGATNKSALEFLFTQTKKYLTF